MPDFDPLVKPFRLALPPPKLGDNRAHDTRLRAEAETILGHRPAISLRALKALGKGLPAWGYELDAVAVFSTCKWTIAHAAAPGKAGKALALGVDLGSTSVVFYLVDASSGEILETKSCPNPQIVHGEDILDRILFAGRNDGLRVLQRQIVDLFNNVMLELASAHGATPENIFFITVAGNTTMCHFLLGLDPSNICKEPYIPAANRVDLMNPGDIGLRANPDAGFYCFPNVGSYFGGDLIAGILASGMHRSQEISMLVDVGTNAEVVLGNQDWLVACAGAAGPALEGGILSCGMRAREGAIERVKIDPVNLDVKYQTIGNAPPRGLCGSGIIDLLAAMFEAGLVDQTGKLVLQWDRKRIVERDRELIYIVAAPDQSAHGQPVYISQSDIKNLIRSKGAMYTILNVVIQSIGIDFDDIEHFYVAGAFGSYIDPQRAVTIGMLPDIPLDRFKGLGNAAGDGAVQLLLRKGAMKEVEEICDRITYLEMNVRKDFMNQLTGALFLPHTDLSRFPSVAKKLNVLGRP